MKKKLLIVMAIVALMISTAGISSAISIAESGDAGDSLLTAQMLGGGIDVITGNINQDADIFGFTWAGGLFTVDTFSSTISDTQLFLFNDVGAGLFSNDDTAGLLSQLSATLATGNYFLAISTWDNDPLDAGGNLIFPTTFSGQFSAYDNDPLASWSGPSGTTGSYEINFTSGQTATPDPVPEPVTMLLFGTGIAGLAGSRLRRKKK